MFISKLRERTSRLHGDLDSKPVLAKLLHDSIANEDILLILKLFKFFYTSIHCKLKSKNIVERYSDSECYQLFVKSVLLRLNWLQTISSGESYELFFEHMKFQSNEHLVGCYYVIEGSSLGGLRIYSKLKTNSKINDQLKIYFKGYHNRAHFKWNQVVDYINNYVEKATDSQKESILYGAEDCFKELIALFGNSKLIEDLS